MALTDLAQPDDDTHNLMRVAQDIPNQTAATVWPLVAYDDGVLSSTVLVTAAHACLDDLQQTCEECVQEMQTRDPVIITHCR